MKRRTFLKGTLAGSVLAIAAGAGLLRPTEVLAADWPASAFGAHNLNDALQGAFGSTKLSANKAIKIKAPIQAENGAVVPVAIDASKIKGVESVAILVEKNPSPLAASVMTPGAIGYFSARIKMGKSSPVIAVVKAGGKLHSAKKTIKVTVGGCGG
ncbi:MAG: thiosulfate oxidation carrier protein SoxY [Proteobacteria bacterium]|nr:thiosulfate oxidation carrier protein SoxY [Pseudomonadota bacterium]